MSKLATSIALGVLVSPLAAQVTERVSVGAAGVQANGAALFGFPGRVVSADGRYIAWRSNADNLVPGDTNSAADVFVHDRIAQTTEIASIDSQGNHANGDSGVYGISMSPDGRFVAFESAASNLVPGDTNGTRDIFVRDRLMGTTDRVSLSTLGTQANSLCFYPSISADGRYVAFSSLASNLVTGDTNGTWDVFIHDRQAGTTERVSTGSGGVQGNGASYRPEISADGAFLVFESVASNLVSNSANGPEEVFFRDLTTGVNEIASVSSSGAQSGFSYAGSVSAGGNFVFFVSAASTLTPTDTNQSFDCFLRDRVHGTTECVSLTASGNTGNNDSFGGAVSDDGRFVLFYSYASDLIPNDVNGASDTFLRDRLTGTTTLVSVSSNGVHGTASSGLGSMSPDGRFLVFPSDAANLVPGDTNGYADFYIRDLFASGFTSICDPGIGAVINCPCGNPPASTGRGCDNSSATGGAVLSASGAAYLSTDGLVFTTAGERPTATSMLVQGDAEISSGLVFGQGVRCVGGSIKRLYLKAAVAGSISAPDFSVGDPSVSARSFALGAPIQPGQPYYYLVYYRDPIVLGGCPASSGFNATQTGTVTWWP